MIKKSVFEDEIIAGMQRELQPLVKQASSSDLVKAADYLNAAFEILDESGLTKQADEILDILQKIAESKRQKLPAIQILLDAGVSQQDFLDFGRGNQFAKAKINKALRDAGFSDETIGTFIGKQNVLKPAEIDELLGPQSSLNKILRMIENPDANIPGQAPRPGEEIEMSSLAAKNKKPKNPTKVSDRHTKGLTPEKMVKNLLHHGTEFNMADDSNADDLLNLEINDNVLEVSENEHNPEMEFEDEI